jgi:hypothetical protein
MKKLWFTLIWMLVLVGIGWAALPTQSTITTLNFVKNGMPWCGVPAKSTINPQTLDYVKNGLPWGSDPYGAAGITAVMGVTTPSAVFGVTSPSAVFGVTP